VSHSTRGRHRCGVAEENKVVVLYEMCLHVFPSGNPFTIDHMSISKEHHACFVDWQVVADFLMTLTIPIKVLSDAGIGSWQLRVVYCRYSAVLFYTTMYISIILLGLISLDRYLKIVRPFGQGPLQRVRVGQVLSVAVWVVMLSLALPNTILSNRMPDVSKGKLKCTSMKGPAGMLWHEGFNYFCQVRQSVKTLFCVLCPRSFFNQSFCRFYPFDVIFVRVFP